MRIFPGLVVCALTAASAFAVEKSNSQTRQTQISATQTDFQAARPIPVRSKLKLDVSGDNEVCYTIHSLQVAREPGSDATRLVRERTCTPASQFETKSTVLQPK